MSFVVAAIIAFVAETMIDSMMESKKKGGLAPDYEEV